MVAITLTSSGPDTTRKAARDAHALATRLQRLTLEARRISATVNAGLHGRRRAGQGENFWQYRALANGETVNGIDWRRSARHVDQLYVREREWEASHTVLLKIDRTASMRFKSSFASDTKEDRALIIGFALAECLVKAGERVGLVGLTRPLATHHIIDRLAEALISAPNDSMNFSTIMVPARAELVIIGDFLDEIPILEQTLDGVRAQGASAHLVRIIDPAEETFPFHGETELLSVEDKDRLIIGDADRFAERYRHLFHAHGEALTVASHLRHASLITHHTDRPATDALQAVMSRLVQSRFDTYHPAIQTVTR